MIPEINDSNFEQYFFDIKKHPHPKKGQVMACWRSAADFVDGWVKNQVVEMLMTNKMGAESAVKVLRKIVGVLEKDAIRVCREITEDILANKSIDDILDKPYRFVIELFYWTNLEYVPDDPHWSVVRVFDLTKGEVPLLAETEL